MINKAEMTDGNMSDGEDELALYEPEAYLGICCYFRLGADQRKSCFQLKSRQQNLYCPVWHPGHFHCLERKPGLHGLGKAVFHTCANPEGTVPGCFISLEDDL